MATTTNYGWNKPAATDTTGVRTDINSILDAIDTSVKSVADAPAASHALRGSTHTDSYRPTAADTETFSRTTRLDNVTLLSTGRLSLFAIHLTAGQVVNTITFMSGSTALSAGTNQWFALYSSALAKLRVTADDTSTAWSANSIKALDLSAAYTVVTSGLYYIGACVVAGTPPTLLGVVWNTANANVAPVLGQHCDSSLTDPASAPTTATFASNSAGLPWAYVT